MVLLLLRVYMSMLYKAISIYVYTRIHARISFVSFVVFVYHSDCIRAPDALTSCKQIKDMINGLCLHLNVLPSGNF